MYIAYNFYIFIEKYKCPYVSVSLNQNVSKWNVVQNLVFIMFNKKFCQTLRLFPDPSTSVFI